MIHTVVASSAVPDLIMDPVAMDRHSKRATMVPIRPCRSTHIQLYRQSVTFHISKMFTHLVWPPPPAIIHIRLHLDQCQPYHDTGSHRNHSGIVSQYNNHNNNSSSNKAPIVIQRTMRSIRRTSHRLKHGHIHQI